MVVCPVADVIKQSLYVRYPLSNIHLSPTCCAPLGTYGSCMSTNRAFGPGFHAAFCAGFCVLKWNTWCHGVLFRPREIHFLMTREQLVEKSWDLPKQPALEPTTGISVCLEVTSHSSGFYKFIGDNLKAMWVFLCRATVVHVHVANL